MTTINEHTFKVARVQDQDLRGKIAIVTGASKGIGRAITIDLATRGADVIGTFSSSASRDLFNTLVDDIRDLYASSAPLAPPRLSGISADITSPSAPVTIIEFLQGTSSKVDIVVFNAAVMGLARMGEGSVDQNFVSRAMAGNVQFPVLLMEELVSANCLRPGGRIVAISSEGVRTRRPGGGSVYAATKAALECLMRQWADELGKRPGMEGTTFNSVSVGFTKTDAYNRIPADMREKLAAADAAEVAVGNRIGEAEDVADVVGLLVSERSRWISGSVVDATGGKAKIM